MPQYDKTGDTDSAINANPRVGIVIVCHNNQETILTTIQSVIQQDYPAITLLIIDNGSSDNSETTIRQLMKDIKTDHIEGDETFTMGFIENIPTIFIHCMHQSNSADAKNKAILALWQSVKYYMFLGAQDYIAVNKVSASTKIVEDDPRVGIVYGDIKINDYVEFTQPYNRDSLEQTSYIPSDAFISKTAIEHANTFNPKFSQYSHWDLFLRITESFAAVHIPLVMSHTVSLQQTTENENEYQTIIDTAQKRKSHNEV